MRINSLDGLRAVAILLVLLIHHKLFNNGWMGVDLFFVLSGFLITQILRADRGEHFYWKRFYIKRVTRIVPPMALTILLAYLFTPKASAIAAFGYMLSLGGLIEFTRFHIIPLGPLWSLAIEEHFYLVWPFAVRFLPRRWLLAALGALLVVVPSLRFLFSHPMPMAQLSVIYFLTPFRIDEMGFGCLLAILIESEKVSLFLKRWSVWMFSAATAVYLGLWVKLHHIYFFPGAHTRFFDSIGYSLVGLICFMLIAHVRLNPNSWASRLFSFAPLAWIGRISYGVYLYHLLVKSLVMWATGIKSEPLALTLDFPLVLLLSWLSFRYYELPIMHWGKKRADQLRTARVRPIVTPETAFDSFPKEVTLANHEATPLRQELRPALGVDLKM